VYSVLYMVTIIPLFQHLPLDVVHIILVYDGTIKYRKGEYVNQLSPWDSRRIMLRNFWTPLRLPFTWSSYRDRIRTEVDFVFSPFTLYCEECPYKKYIRYYFLTIRQENDEYMIHRDVYLRY